MSIDIDNPLVVFKSDGRMYVMDRPKAMMFEEYAATMSWRTVAERTKAKAVWQYQQASIDGLLEDRAKDRARIDELEHKLALRDAFIAGVQFAETERLREKKKQIYEDLEDAVGE